MANPSEVKAYLKGRQRSSLAEIAIHFDTSPDAALAALGPWLTKNKVRRVEGLSGCGGSCGKACCDGGSAAEVYEWVGP